MAKRPPKIGEPTDPLAELRRFKPRGATMTERPAAMPPVETESQRFRDLLDVAVSLTSSLELKAILDAIVDGIIRVTSCQRGFVILRESDDTFAMYTGRLREGAPWDENSAREISSSVVARVAETHETFIGLDLSEIDELREQKSILAQRIRSAVCLPLIDQDHLIGVIYADSSFPIPSFSETDRAILNAFGSQAAVAIERARQHGDIRDRGERLEEQNRQLREQLGQHVAMSGMIIRNKRMLDVFMDVQRIGAADMSSVLIHGESGTGKELLARAIHEKSPRHGGPFVAFNAAAISPTLVESALFGHRRGAFTGAEYDKPGYFEKADGGTLFLDEIGDMTLELQSKLLRVLQQREIERLGEEGRIRTVDVHVVAATNKDLPRAVQQKTFREDLFFRLTAAQLSVPPLRDRREDILPLAEYFLQRFAERRHQPAPTLSRDARAFLLGYYWRGNVRELENMMEWAVAFQDENGVVNGDALERKAASASVSPVIDTAAGEGSLRQLVDRYEERMVRDALSRNDNNVSATAKALGLSRQMLHEKIKKYGIVTRES
jgi:transcriptional regulator with GAF, ATPase, and Fis domain